MLTNRLNLPDGIVAAVANDPYTRGDSDISVTQLIAPPYQRKLRETTEVVEDVSDRIWSLLGQSVHSILERAHAHEDDGVLWRFFAKFLKRLKLWDAIKSALDLSGYKIPDPMSAAEMYAKHGSAAEHRLYADYRGWRVSGQFDVIEDGCLQDFKVTSVWAVKGDTKAEWEQQLNLLRLLAYHSGIEVDSLRIIAILRDWSKARANDPSYPSSQVVALDIPMWSLEQAEAYMIDRVTAHQATNPPVCSDIERWKKEDVFAVMKNGRKTAVKLHEAKESALRQVGELTVDHYIEKRPGGYTRCESYCNVSGSCPAMKEGVPF